MKKILLLFAVFSTALLAQEHYFMTVNDSAMVDGYWTIFNFIASLFQSGDYFSALKLAAMIGATIAFAGALVTKGFGDPKAAITAFSKQMFVMTTLLTLVFSHQSTVVIQTDNLVSSYYSDTTTTPDPTTTITAIANVPTSFAYIISGANKIGTGLEKLFRMGFSTVDSYDIHGFAKDTHNTIDVLNLQLGDLHATAGVAVRAFLTDCVVMPTSADSANGTNFMEDLYRSENIMTFLGTHMDNNTTINGTPMGKHTVEIGSEIYECQNIYDQLTTTIIPEAKLGLERLFKDTGPGVMQVLTGTAGVPVNDFEERAIHAGMINMVKETGSSIANGSDLEYATGKTRAQFIQESQGNAHFLATQLPYMQSMLRAIIIALFPAIFLLLFFPGTFSILKAYFISLIWIELWNPITSILNYFIVTGAANKVSGIGVPLTVESSSIYFTDVVTYSGVAAYLYASTPMIAGVILTGAFMGLQGIASNVAGKMSTNLNSDSMAKDSAKMTQQKIAQADRAQKVSMAALSMEGANQGAWNSAAELDANRLVGMEDTMRQKKFGIQAPVKSLQEKINQAGNADHKGMEKVMNQEAKAAGADFNQKAGELEQVGNLKDYKEYGAKQGSDIKGNAENVKKHGIDKIQDNATKSISEDIVTKDTRFGEIEKSGKTVDQNAQMKAQSDYHGTEKPGMNTGDLDGSGSLSNSELDKLAGVKTKSNQEDLVSKGTRQIEIEGTGSSVNDFAANKSRVDFNSQEAPGVAKGDLNGDGTTDRNELDKLNSTNTKEGQAAHVSKMVEQSAKEAKGQELLNSPSKAVRDAARSAQSIAGNAGAALAVNEAAIKGGNVQSEAFTSNLENTKVENFDQAGVNEEDLAESEVSRKVEETSLAQNRGTTARAVITDSMNKDLNSEFSRSLEVAHENGLKGQEAHNAASHHMLNSAAQMGLRDTETTRRALNSDMDMIQSKADTQIDQLAYKAKDLQGLEKTGETLEAIKARANEYEEGSVPHKMLMNQANNFEASINKKLDQFGLTSNDLSDMNESGQSAQEFMENKIQEKADMDKAAVINDYQDNGFIRTNNGNIEYADSREMLNNLEGEDLNFATAKIKGAMESNKINSATLSGHDIKVSKGISGKDTSNFREATFGLSESGRYNSDILYNAKENLGDKMDDQVVAYVSTGVGHIGNVTQTVGLGKAALNVAKK